MYTVTSDFKTAATANYRKPMARVLVEWDESQINNQFNVTTNDSNRASHLSQTVNANTVTTHKWAHLHSDLRLDGSFYAMPYSINDGEVGWYTASLCNASRVWIAHPYIETFFSERKVTRVQVVFDTEYNEYAEEFIVNFYNGTNFITGNTTYNNTQLSVEINFTNQNITNATSMMLRLVRWSSGSKVGKVNNFTGTFSQSLFYGDDIVNLNVLEETDFSKQTLPYGNVSSNELNLSLLNTDARFLKENINSPFYNKLTKNKKIKLWLGFKLLSGSTDTSSGSYIVETIEGDKYGFLPYGVYWSKQWDSDYNTLTATVKARDTISLMKDLIFEDSDIYKNYTLYQLAKVVLEKFLVKAPVTTYTIDTSLQEISVPIAWFDRETFYTSLKRIVEAATTTMYCNREGQIIIQSRLNS